MSIADTLLAPFQFEFMINALVVSALVSVPMALLSCFLVLKGWSLMGDAIGHAVFPGVVIAYAAGFPYAVGAFAAGMLCAVATGFLKDNSRIKRRPGTPTYEPATAAIPAGIIGLKWKDFLLHAFDPAQARAIGLRVGLLHYGLLCLISLTIVGALQAVGIILAIAMLIAPGAIAFLLARTFGAMLLLSVAIAVSGSLLGVYLSFFLDSAPAPTIVLLHALLFVLAFVFATRKAARMERGEAL